MITTGRNLLYHKETTLGVSVDNRRGPRKGKTRMKDAPHQQDQTKKPKRGEKKRSNPKKDQEIQILSLLHYLEKSMLEANLTERMVLEARNEEKILLNKLSNIRGELKEITENVEEVVKDNLIEDNLVDEK